MSTRLSCLPPALLSLAALLPAQLTWRDASATLPPRAGHFAFFDDARGRVTVLGGQVAGAAYGEDCWQLGGGAWVQVPIPPGNQRGYGACCEDPSGFGAGLVFGGNDSSGFLVPSTLRWNRQTLRFDTLSPALSPPPRWITAMALDTARGRVVLFGGGDSFGPLGDTWEWDGFNWQQRSPAQSPPARANHAMTYDAARNRVVLYGGHNGASLADTWLYDGTTWSNAPVTGPGALHNLMLAYDQSRSVVVKFGGKNDGSVVNDSVWEWNGSAWTGPLQPASRPSARELASLTYDKQLRRVTLVGGQDQAAALLGDAWQWNGSAWTQLLPGNRGTLVEPSPRSTPVLAYSEQRNNLVLFGGYQRQGLRIFALADTWESAGEMWQQRTPASSPPASYAAAGAMLRGTGSLCVVPGKDGLGNPFNAQWVLGSNGQWSGVNLAAAPIAPAHQVLGSLFSSQLGWVLVRLVTSGSSPFQNSTLQLIVPNTGVVQPMFPSGGPAPLQGSTMAQSNSPSIAANKVWLFGGSIQNLTGTSYSSDLWELADTGSGGNLAWTLLVPAAGSPVPPPRLDAAVGYSPRGNCITIMGGSDATTVALGDSWSFDLTTRRWTQLGGSLPAPRRGAVIATSTDGGFEHLVLIGGSDGTTEFNDTWWSISGSAWSQRQTLTWPGARIQHAMVYDRANHGCVLFSGLLTRNDTWRYDGTTWRPIVGLGTTPGPRAEAMACYDEAHSTMVMYGGVVASLPPRTATAETWLLSAAGEWSQGSPGPGPAAGGAMVYLASQQCALMFGSNGTWTYHVTTNQWLTGPAGPTPRIWHAMAYDRLRDRVVLFGGNVNGTGSNDTWEYAPATGWQQRTPAHTPPGRMMHLMAYDESRARTVMCGGFGAQSVDAHGDVWEWDGNDWSQRQPDTRGVGRMATAMVYDPDRARLMYFGGGAQFFFVAPIGAGDSVAELDARIDTAGRGNTAHPEPLRFYSQPVLGQPLRLGFANPQGVGIYTLGWGPVQQPLGPLPVPPGCEASNVYGLLASQLVMGTAEPQIAWIVPNTPLILGVTLVFQGFAIQAANCWRATDALHVHF